MTKRLQAELKERVDYDPSTGVFTWRKSGHGKFAGDVAGKKNQKGRRQISFDGRLYCANRLAFLWMTGRSPKHLIDHKDIDPTNDRWDNLRESTHSQNLANMRLSPRNTTGFKGVSFHKRQKKYCAHIRHNNLLIHLGSFDSPEQAHEAYKVKAEEIFGAFARFF